MDEPRQHDAGASLTDSVRQFRRVARLADADPLRLMPLDALAQLASLSAPVADLIDLAPFERLRHGVAAPPAAPRRDPPRMRLQPFAGAGHDVRTKPAAAAECTRAPGRQSKRCTARRTAGAVLVAGRCAIRGRAAHDAMPHPRRHLRSAAPRCAGEPSTRDRRRGRPHRSWHRRRQRRARAARPSTRRARSPSAPATARASTRRSVIRPVEQRPMPVDPVLFDRDNVTSPSNDPFASAALDRATHDALFADDPPTASAPSDRSSAPAPLAAVGIPAGRDMPAAAVRRDPNDPGLVSCGTRPFIARRGALVTGCADAAG